jgi:hypothetical protein
MGTRPCRCQDHSSGDAGGVGCFTPAMAYPAPERSGSGRTPVRAGQWINRAKRFSPGRLRHSPDADQSAAFWPLCRRTGLRDLGRCALSSKSSASPFVGRQARQSIWVADLRSWSPRSDSNRRPSDYESDRSLSTGPAQTHPGCSAAGPIPSGAVLCCLVSAPGLPKWLPPISVGAGCLPRFGSLSIRLRSDARSQRAAIDHR